MRITGTTLTLLLAWATAGPALAEPTERVPTLCHELDAPPLALAASDLDGDGREELLVLLPDELRALRPVETRYEHYAALSLSQRPHRRQHTRATVGALAAGDLDGDGKDEVAFGTSDLLAGGVVYWTGLRFREVRSLTDLPVGLSVVDQEPTFFLGSLQPGTNVFSTAVLAPVQRADPTPQSLAAPSLALAAQPTLENLAALTPEGELVVWGRDGAVVGRLDDVGQAFALRELEGEALPELIVTDPVRPPTPDRVRVLALGGDGPHLLWSSAAIRGQVVAVTALDLGPDGRRVVFAVVPTGEHGARVQEVRW